MWLVMFFHCSIQIWFIVAREHEKALLLWYCFFCDFIFALSKEVRPCSCVFCEGIVYNHFLAYYNDINKPDDF